MMVKPASAIGGPRLGLTPRSYVGTDEVEAPGNSIDNMLFEYTANCVQSSAVEELEFGHMPPNIYISDVALAVVENAIAEAR